MQLTTIDKPTGDASWFHSYCTAQNTESSHFYFMKLGEHSRKQKLVLHSADKSVVFSSIVRRYKLLFKEFNGNLASQELQGKKEGYLAYTSQDLSQVHDDNILVTD